VTGSNSVNVFLGLGVPWTVSALYWQLVDSEGEATVRWRSMYPEMAHFAQPVFVVRQKNLGFSVFAFGVVCGAALVLLHFRRKWLSGELGGPRLLKHFSAVVFLGFWLGWVGIVTWRVLRWQNTASFNREAQLVQGACLLATVLVTAVTLFMMKMHHRRRLVEATKFLNAKRASERDESKLDASSSVPPKDISVDISTMSIFDVRFPSGEITEVRV